MTITAAEVKKLRDATGAGMMDCKKALSENNGDFEASIDWLRKKGIAKAAKKGGRVAAEGVVFLVAEGNKGAMVEVNSETDFVAKNDKFKDFVEKTAKIVLDTKIENVEELKAAEFPGGSTVEATLTDLIATIGENMNLRRAKYLEVETGTVAAYSHMGGKIGVLVALKSDDSSDELAKVAKNVAMHVAASNPQALNREAVDPASLEREKAIYVEQAAQSGKPANVVEKMVEGRINKFYKEICLVEQPFIMDTDKTVAKVAEEAKAEVVAYSRFGLGEGIEKKEDDFAAEVAAMTN